MKNIIRATSVLLLMLTIIGGCTKDFVVKNIKNATINVVAPADNLSTPSNSVIFWWEEVDGAEKYNLQIVKPNFNSVAQLVVDTNITGTKFSHTFTPGTYQWRVKATNAGGSTAYITRTFVIDTTSNLAYLSVSPILPASNYVTKSKIINFAWNPLPPASYYELTLNNVSTGSITIISNISNTAYTYTSVTTADAVYSWSVKAFNLTSQSNQHVPRSFKIDLTSPAAASIFSPNTYSMSIRDTTFLKWSRNVASTDINYDILAISSDSTFTSTLASANAYSVTPTRINSIYSYSSTPMQLWWRVSSVDTAGNISTPSQSKRFYLH